MKLSVVSLLRLVMLFMVLVIFIVPSQFLPVVFIVQIGYVIVLLFLRRRPPKPIRFGSSTWTVEGNLTGYDTRPIHPR